MAHQCAAPAGCCVFILYGRAGVHARRKTSCTARSRFARCLSRIVGAACMRPVKRCTHHPFTVCMVFASHGRAGDFARRTDDFSNFKNNNVGRGQDPALQTGANGQPTVTPARWRTPAGRHSCLPYKHPVPRTRTKSVATGQTSPGRMHAAPTNRPGRGCLPNKHQASAGLPACERGRGFRTGARMSRTGSKETVL